LHFKNAVSECRKLTLIIVIFAVYHAWTLRVVLRTMEMSVVARLQVYKVHEHKYAYYNVYLASFFPTPLDLHFSAFSAHYRQTPLPRCHRTFVTESSMEVSCRFLSFQKLPSSPRAGCRISILSMHSYRYRRQTYLRYRRFVNHVL